MYVEIDTNLILNVWTIESIQLIYVSEGYYRWEFISKESPDRVYHSKAFESPERARKWLRKELSSYEWINLDEE